MRPSLSQNLCVFFSVGAVACTPRPATESGLLAGVITFVGKPSPDGSGKKGPPFDGPYPNYALKILNANGKSVAAQTRSDHEGRYTIELAAGTYVIHTQNGLRPDDIKRTTVTIRPGETTRIDLSVDTGVR